MIQQIQLQIFQCKYPNKNHHHYNDSVAQIIERVSAVSAVSPIMIHYYYYLKVFVMMMIFQINLKKHRMIIYQYHNHY